MIQREKQTIKVNNDFKTKQNKTKQQTEYHTPQEAVWEHKCFRLSITNVFKRISEDID